MRGRTFYLLLIVLSLACQPKQLAASPLEAVSNTRHNLVAPEAASGNACIVCHTGKLPWSTSEALPEPSSDSQESSESHEESADLKDKLLDAPLQSPLWNRVEMEDLRYSAIQTVPLDEHPYNHPTGSSLICLSCHDGALGGDMHGINVDNPRVGASAKPAWNGMAGPLGSPPLSRVDHPVSIIYPRKPNGTFVPHNATVTRSRYWALPDRHAEGLTLPTAGTSSYLDLPKGEISNAAHLSSLVRTTGGLMECDSCHNPHSEKVRPFLRVPSKTLCLVCHDR